MADDQRGDNNFFSSDAPYQPGAHGHPIHSQDHYLHKDGSQWGNSTGYDQSYSIAGHSTGHQHQRQNMRHADFTADDSELNYGSFRGSATTHPVSQQHQQQLYPFQTCSSHMTAVREDPAHFRSGPPAPLPPHERHMHHTTQSIGQPPFDHPTHPQPRNQFMTDLRTASSLSTVSEGRSHQEFVSRESETKAVLPSTESQYEGSFMSKVQKFVVKHREIFNALTQDRSTTVDTLTLHNHSSYSEESYKYAEPDALEYQMQVDTTLRKKRFLELVSVGDVMRGSIVYKSHGELTVQITSFVGSHKLRELTDIDIKGVLPLENLSSSAENCDDVMKDMQTNDVVQVLVVCQQEDGILLLSFREDHVEQLCYEGRLPPGVKLGYMEGRKADIQRTGKVKVDDYLHQLEDDPGFTNPSCTENLKAVLGIATTGTKPLGPGMRPTLLKDIQMAEYPESEYCHALRKAQRNKWSMDTVAMGVKHLKGGNHSKALEMLDHALKIDPENVEGLVARGALYANRSKYKQGIADFERALTLKHTHKNARKYLVQTQVAYGEMLEKEGKLQQAMRCYREALADDPGEKTAKERLGLLTAALEKQAADRKEMERQKAEEKTKLKKLYKIIEEEKEKKIRKFNKKIKQSTRRKRKSSKSSKKHHKRGSSKSSKAKRKDSRHQRYSSSSDLSTSSDYSRSRSRSSSRSSSRSRSRSKSRSRSFTPVSKISKRLSRSPRRSRSRSRSPVERNRKSKSRSSRVRSRSRSTSVSVDRGKKTKRSHRHSRSRSRSPAKERIKQSRSMK